MNNSYSTSQKAPSLNNDKVSDADFEIRTAFLKLLGHSEVNGATALNVFNKTTKKAGEKHMEEGES